MNKFKIGDYAILKNLSSSTTGFKINEIVKIVSIYDKFENVYKIESKNKRNIGYCNENDILPANNIKNVIFSKNGRGNPSPRINLSYSKLKEMNINENERQVNIIYKKDEIIIRKEFKK